MENLMIDRLYKLINVNLTINDNYDNFEVVLQRLLHAIEVITNSEATSLLVYESYKKDLQFRFATGKTAISLLGLKVPQGQGIAHSVAKTRKGVVVNNPKDFGHYSGIDKTINYNTRNLMAFPMQDNNGEVFGVVEACNKKNGEDFTKEDFEMLSIFCQQAERTIRHALHIHSLKKTIVQLHRTVEELKLTPLIYVSKDIKRVVQLLKEIAPSNSPTLITGDIGTGKSLCAQYLHSFSQRKTQPIIVIDCNDLIKTCENLKDMRIKLWGIDRNYKIGIKQDIVGLFEQSKTGTVVIDEIGVLPLEIQQEILQLLKNKYYYKIDNEIPITLDTRVVCTSTKNLDDLVENKSFNKELYYILNSLSIHLTPINSRIEDLQAISEYYVYYFIRKYRKPILEVDEKIYVLLKRYVWKQNLHTLINTIEYLVLYCNEVELSSSYIAAYMYTLMGEDKTTHESLEQEEIVTLREAINGFKTRYIYKALLHNNWNHTKTSKILDIQRSYLSRLVKEYQLKTKNVLSKSIVNDMDEIIDSEELESDDAKEK